MRQCLLTKAACSPAPGLTGRVLAPRPRSLPPHIGEANETDQRSRYVGLCGLFVFYYRLFKPNLDKKFFKTLFVIHKKAWLVERAPTTCSRGTPRLKPRRVASHRGRWSSLGA